MSLVWWTATTPGVAASPPTIYVYDMDGASFNSRVMMASLSGVVARTSPEVHMAYGSSAPLTDPEFWLDRHLENNPGTAVQWQSNPLWFIDRYKGMLNGYVVYDGGSINQATSVAGALGALMVEQSLLSGPVGSALSLAGLQQIEDVRGRSSDWAYDTYRDSYNKDFIYRQQPTFSHQLRSHAVKFGGFVFDETGATRDRFLAGQNPHSAVVGWGYGNSEGEFFGSASDLNLTAVPADHLQSGASLSGWTTPPPNQSHASPALPTTPDKHYVAFVMSDGDNVQWLSGEFGTNPRWFGSPHRGEFPMTFDLTPSLADFNPTAMKYIYDQAAADGGNTYLINPGGYGINYPSRLTDVDGWADRSAAAMADADQTIISILDNTYDKSALNALVERPGIEGVMFKTNADAYAGNRGEIYWHNGKPIASVKYTLWDGFETPNELVSLLNSAPRQPLTNKASYTIVNVHPWSTSLADGGQGDPMSNVSYIVNRLDPGVEVVTLDELYVHLTNNRWSLQSRAVGDNLVRNGDFEIAAAGVPNRPAQWFYAAAPATSIVMPLDSDGSGARAAAISAAGADWRSAEFAVTSGVELEFTFDFMFENVPDSSGFRADARFFTASQQAGGTFAGETAPFVDAADYESGVWHSFTTTAVVPVGASVGDVRFSTYFAPFTGGTVYIDNVSLRYVISGLPGDFNQDGVVDAADYTLWRDSKSSSVTPGSGADADYSGVVDNLDYDLWRDAYGLSVSSATNAVPEPCGILSAAVLAIVLVGGNPPSLLRRASSNRPTNLFSL